jgi:hypothetical protein
MNDEEVQMDAHVAAVGEIGLIRGAAHRVLLTAFDGEKEAYRGLRDAAEKDFRNQIGVKIQHHRGRAETILMKVAQESDKSVRALEKELHDVVISSWLRGNQGTVPSILQPFIVPALYHFPLLHVTRNLHGIPSSQSRCLCIAAPQS